MEFKHAFGAQTKTPPKYSPTNIWLFHSLLSWKTGSYRFPRIFSHLIGCWTEQTWRVWIMLEGCAFCKQIMLMNVLASGFLFLFIGPFKHVSSGDIKETGRKALFVWSERCLPERLRVKEFSVIARVSFIRIYSLATHAAEVIFPCAKWCFILDCDIEVPFHC